MVVVFRPAEAAETAGRLARAVIMCDRRPGLSICARVDDDLVDRALDTHDVALMRQIIGPDHLTSRNGTAAPVSAASFVAAAAVSGPILLRLRHH